jgi:two-component system, cell cycle response regulator DivK
MPSHELVLLVNDIPDHARAYADALVRQGYRVQEARTGEEALTAVTESPPACAVIDLRLPDMSGWELCRALRRREECEAIRIVVLTPDVSRMSANDSARVGCNAWLTHPAVAEDLVRTVRQVLQLDSTEPSSAEDAMLSLITCPACGSERVRPTLRISPIQYYCCSGCRFCWRVEVLKPSGKVSA